MCMKAGACNFCGDKTLKACAGNSSWLNNSGRKNIMGISSSRPSTTTPVSPPTVTESGQQSGAILPPEVLRSDQPDLPAAPPGHTASELTHDLGAPCRERVIRGAKLAAASLIAVGGAATAGLSVAGLDGQGPFKDESEYVGHDFGGLGAFIVFCAGFFAAVAGVCGVARLLRRRPASNSPQTGPNVELQRQGSAASELPGVSTQV